MEACALCETTLPRKRKWNQREKKKITAKVRGTDTTLFEAMQLMYAYEGKSDAHVCGACCLKTERGYRVFQNIPGTSTPGKALQNSKYYAALRHILDRGPAAQRAFQKLVKNLIQKEVRTYAKTSTNYPQLAGSSSIKEFQWEPLLDSMSDNMPLLFTSIQSAMPMLKEEQYRSLSTPRLGFILSIPLYARNPRKYHFLQALTGVQMWRCGSSEKLFRSFNKLGICQSSSAIRNHIQKLCDEPDVTMNEWKNALENNETPESKIVQSTSKSVDNIKTADDPESMRQTTSKSVQNLKPSDDPATMATSHNSSTSDDEWEDQSDDESDGDYEPNSVEIDTSVDYDTAEEYSNFDWSTDGNEDNSLPKEGCGYALVWDNTQLLVHTRNQSREKQNEMKLWANCYAARNRVEPMDLDDNDLTLSTFDIPMSSYFQSNEDEVMLRKRMETIVGRIITKNIPYFKKYEKYIQWHIPHPHDEESAQKSELVNIGIIEANPSSTDGVITISEKLQQYVPRRKDGSYRVVPTHGDGLSVERMLDAKRARSAEHIDSRKLDGLIPTPQEFHHRGIMLQDTMNKLFHNGSINERGTLSQLKHDFKHKNVSKDVMNSFNHVENFIRFVTESNICYLTLELLNMDHINSEPSSFAVSKSPKESKDMLSSLCSNIVNELWSLTPDADIQAVLEADEENHQKDWCICDEEKDGPMLKCSSSSCPLGTWFHLSCLDMREEDQPAPDTDWWCSTECQETGESCLCKCRRVKDGPTIRCSRGNDCPYGVLFHLDCVQLTAIPDDKWFCSRMCSEVGGEEQDHIRNYAIAATWNGLLDLCHRDMIREADGHAMMSMWRLNVPRFWAGNHYKYLIIAHRLLAGDSGWLPPRLMEEIRNNRTVNLRGGKGKNIAMDRENEFFNCDYKDTMKHTNGQYSSDTIHRAGRIVGPLGEAIDRAFEQQIAEINIKRNHRKRANYEKDIHEFLEEYRSDKLFTFIPGREHKSYPGFKCDQKIDKPGNLRARLVRYNDKLERTRKQKK